MRQNIVVLFVVSQFVSIGMWLERFVIIPVSLYNTHLPSAQKVYTPTVWDFAMFFGTIGFFLMMMMLFVRGLPFINMFEMKDLLHRIGHKPELKEAALPAGGGE
jgi:molybdopterin-containing oxidoreductase family membrane subunit